MIKPTKQIMSMCDEMYEKMTKYGHPYPWCWNTKSREKLEQAGVVQFHSRSCEYGDQYYFTESGLKWYLEMRSQK